MVAVLRAQETEEAEEVVEGVVKVLAEDDDRLDLPDLNGRTALHLASMLRRDISSILINAYNMTFPCMEANYPYAIENQRGARNTPIRGYFCDELVLYARRLGRSNISTP